MAIGDRYIAKQIIVGTLYSVVLLSMILMMGLLFRYIRDLLVDQQAPIGLIFRFLLSVLPYPLLYTLPWGLLVTVLLVFGRLSSSNELLGFRCAGQSLYRVALPVITVALACSLVCYYIASSVAPAAKRASRELMYETIKNDPSLLLDPGVVRRLPGVNVYLEKREGTNLSGLHVYTMPDEEKGDGKTSYIHAKQAGLTDQAEQKRLRVAPLEQTYIETQNADGSFEIVKAEEAEPFHFDYSSKTKLNYKPNRMTNKEIAEILESGSIPPELSVNRLIHEQHKRYALSFSCLIFALIGIPLGIQRRRSDTSTGLISSIIIAGLYFGLGIVGDQFDEAPLHTFIPILWLPNILGVIGGGFLFNRANYH